MKRAALFLSRMVMIIGLMIALTPCGFCQKTGGQKCLMTHASTCSCCHNQKASSFCQIMDQSTVPVPAQAFHMGPGSVVSGAAGAISFSAFVLKTAFVPRAVPLSSSPPRGFSVLRI